MATNTAGAPKSAAACWLAANAKMLATEEKIFLRLRASAAWTRKAETIAAKAPASNAACWPAAQNEMYRRAPQQQWRQEQ